MKRSPSGTKSTKGKTSGGEDQPIEATVNNARNSRDDTQDFPIL